MRLPYQNFLDYQIHCILKIPQKGRTKRFSKKRLSQIPKLVENILRELYELPFFIYPEKDILLDYVKKFRGTREKRVFDKKYQARLEKIKEIISDTYLRKRIEILIMLGTPDAIILSTLLQKSLLTTELELEDLEAFRFWFFNYSTMDDIDRNFFFSQVRIIEYFELHSHLYFRTAPVDYILLKLGLGDGDEELHEKINFHVQYLANKMDRIIIQNDFESIHKMTKSISTLVDVLVKMGWIKPAGMGPDLSDLIILKKEDPPTTTAEDIFGPDWKSKISRYGGKYDLEDENTNRGE